LGNPVFQVLQQRCGFAEFLPDHHQLFIQRGDILFDRVLSRKVSEGRRLGGKGRSTVDAE